MITATTIKDDAKSAPESSNAKAFLAALLITALSIIPAVGSAQHEGHQKDGYHAEMQAQMQKMNEHMTSAPMTGNPDLDFAVMMIPHHQGAIDMAKTELKYGKDAKLRALAEEIIKSQQKEIQEMQASIQQLKSSGSETMSSATLSVPNGSTHPDAHSSH